MKFSERMGYMEPQTVIQIETIDYSLAMDLWNTVYTNAFSLIRSTSLVRGLWGAFFKWDISEFPLYSKPALKEFKKFMISEKQPWYKKYDFIEFIVDNYPGNNVSILIRELNNVLEKNISGYRFINNKLVSICNKEQVESIERAINFQRNKSSVHLENALTMLANRSAPNYSQVIEESIKAVENVCTYITKIDSNTDFKKTLGQALSEIEKNSNIKIHSALKNAFSQIYGFASDGGIRHAVGDQNPPSQELAIFMLVSCSAFVNYLQVKADRAGIELH